MTITSTRTERPSEAGATTSRTTISVEVAPGRARVGLHATAPPDRPVLRAMLLGSDERGARVSLVPEGALLLAGDEVEIDVRVGPGALLELVEPGGTVAYDMRGGLARWDVRITLGYGAALAWAGEPFVAGAGSTTYRATEVTMAPDARLALRETLVLGRHGEQGGALRQRLGVSVRGVGPVLAEELCVGPGTDPLLLGGRRVVGSQLLLGTAPDTAGRGTRLDLEAGGALLRSLAHDAHEAADPATWAAAVALARG